MSQAASNRPLRLLAVGSGGALGAVARYLVGRGIPTPAGHFPWATFLINMSGSLVLGFFLVLVLTAIPRWHLARLFLATGVIGAYTTFSTFMVDAVDLWRDGGRATAVVYVVATLAGGLAAATLGILAGRRALGPPSAAPEDVQEEYASLEPEAGA